MTRVIVIQAKDGWALDADDKHRYDTREQALEAAQVFLTELGGGDLIVRENGQDQVKRIRL